MFGGAMPAMVNQLARARDMRRTTMLDLASVHDRDCEDTAEAA
jgi:hypothetical protein